MQHTDAAATAAAAAAAPPKVLLAQSAVQSWQRWQRLKLDPQKLPAIRKTLAISMRKMVQD